MAQARELAAQRGVGANRELTGALLDRHAALSPSGRRMMIDALRQQRLTARGVDRVRRVARTLADLAGESTTVLGEEHLSLAMHLRVDCDVLLGAEQ